MIDFTPLDNPIWNALTSTHQKLARGSGWARRYRADISPLAGMSRWDSPAFDDMLQLLDETDPRDYFALFTTRELEIPSAFKTIRTRWIDQMVCAGEVKSPSIAEKIIPLGDADIPEMLALTALTEPGPFSQRTIDMGRYFGIRSGEGRLMSMAGERLGLNEFTEVSAVCTHPDFRGRGLSKALVAFVAEKVRADGKTPFLHVKTENDGAKAVYEKVGFHVRRAIRLTVLGRNS